jgi:hypothetical protein
VVLISCKVNYSNVFHDANHVCKSLEETFGVLARSGLQNHNNEEVSETVMEMLDEYFHGPVSNNNKTIFHGPVKQ